MSQAILVRLYGDITLEDGNVIPRCHFASGKSNPQFKKKIEEVKPLEINSKWSEDSFLCMEPIPIKKAFTHLEWRMKKD